MNPGGLNEAEIGPYFNSTAARFGANSTAFRDSVYRRLSQWGFNALGAWCSPLFFTEMYPFSVDIEATYSAPDAARLAPLSGMPDPFSPEWEVYADARARNVCTPLADMTSLVGYYTDNELGFVSIDDPEGPTPVSESPLPESKYAHRTILQTCLSLGTNSSAFNVSWGFVLGRHGGTLAQLSSDWAISPPLQSPTDVNTRLTAQGLVLANQQFHADAIAFDEYYAGTYFNKTAAYIAKYDPNHLVMGSKFAPIPGSGVIKAFEASPHAVLSQDNYRYNLSSRIAYLQRLAPSKPIIIAEFAWEGSGCPYNEPAGVPLGCCWQYSPTGDPSVGGFPCPVPNEPPAANFSNLERASCNGVYSLASGAAMPSFAGYAKYRWVDHPAKSPDAMRALGMVDIWDQPKAPQVAYMAAINGKLEAIHDAGEVPAPSPPGAPAWLQYCPVN